MGSIMQSSKVCSTYQREVGTDNDVARWPPLGKQRPRKHSEPGHDGSSPVRPHGQSIPPWHASLPTKSTTEQRAETRSRLPFAEHNAAALSAYFGVHGS